MDISTSHNETVSARLLSQRVLAFGRIAAARRDGRTRLATLYQEGAAKIRMPQPEGDWLEAVLINTAGGMTGGDRLAWQVDIGEDASAVVTTQACEKLYRAAHGHAELSARLSVAAGGRLAWLPQETIVYDHAAFQRRLDVDLAEGATALIAETTLFGRGAMGEHVASGRFRDRWRVRVGGRLVHAEDFFIRGDIARQLARGSVTGGAVAISTVLLVGPDTEEWLDRVRTVIGEKGGASAWTVGRSGKLLARLFDDDGYCLRKRLVPLLALLNGRAGLPKTWSL